MFPLLLTEPIITMASVLIGHHILQKNIQTDSLSDVEEKPSSTATIELQDLRNKKLGELLNELTLDELLTLVREQTDTNVKHIAAQVSENLDAIYTDQLAKAQDFVNGSGPDLNIHAVRELLRDLLPDRYHPAIRKLKPGQSVKTLINIAGGNVQIMPNAKTGIQK